MKKIFLLLLIALVFSACKDPKEDEKALLNDVIKIHDKVMGNDERLMQNKMKLDTLSRPDTLTRQYTPTQKATMKTLGGKLVAADKKMENWMQKFDPEQKGRSHAEIMAYFNEQKKQILAVDSTLSAIVKESTNYLKSIKQK